MKFKRALSALLAGVMTASCVALMGSGVSAADTLPFKDVGKKKWYYDEVKYVYDNGLMNGTSKTLFEPNLSLTRAMFVTILGRLAGAQENDNYKTFKDIKKASWYTGYVGWAVDCGIVTGYPDGTFMPDKSLTREEMAACISRYIDALGINMPRESTAPVEFADAKKIGKWAREYVETLRRAGIANGDQYEKYNPKDNITRAEMATVIMNLISAEAKAWQGYEPDIDGDYIALGARYLYSNGTVVAGGLGTELDESEEYPALEAFADSAAAARTYLPEKTVGVSLSALGHSIKDYPVLKISYRLENTVGDTAIARLYSAGEAVGTAKTVSSVERDGYVTAVIDLSELFAAADGISNSAVFKQLLFEPFSADDGEDARFYLRYVIFFKDQSTAESFDAATLDDYLKNYYLYSPASVKAATNAVLDEYDELLVSRIDEILNSKSELTPEQIKASGGKCYYLSTLCGDDSNSGTSPDRPWRSLDKLWDVKAGGLVLDSKPKAGDAVFFERGSVWYPEKYMNGKKHTLTVASGVSYGAYGEGEKPLFTGALDLGSACGTWSATEWKNIYVLDQKIDEDPSFTGENADIGNIIFNGGEAVGMHIRPSDKNDPFGEGKLTETDMIMCNGYEYFDVDVRSCENVGTALVNDLEFFHDWKEGKLYLYCKDANPAERFDSIICSSKATCIYGGGTNNVRIDNLAALYSTYGLIDVNGDNIEISNCEAGYSSGGDSSVDGSIGGYGAFDGYIIRNCYSHDIGDGAVTHQSGDSPNETVNIQNITYENNVFVACGIGVEVWNHVGDLDENGYSKDKLKNITVKGNIIAYMGYGLAQVQGSSLSTGVVLDSSMYAECENCNIYDNVFMHCNGSVLRAYIATDMQQRGWDMRGNTYIFNSDTTDITYMYETMPYTIDHRMNKHQRIAAPYNERYISYYAALGACEYGDFYIYSGLNDAQRRGSFFTTGFYIERGNTPR